MLLSKVKKSIELRTKQKYKIPDDELLADTIFEALLYVSNKCDPAELTRSAVDMPDNEVLKLIEDGKFIAVPEYPDLTSTTKHLQIDELLSYAVINYACFLLTKDASYKQLADEDIAIYRCEFDRVSYGE